MQPDVIIELEKIRDPFSGLGQFSQALANAISKNNHHLNISAILPHHFSIPGIQTISEKRNLFKFSLFVPRAKLWHLTHQDSRYRPQNGANYILTIHDLNDLIEKPIEKTKIMTKLSTLVKAAKHIVCISDYTKTEVLKIFPNLTNITTIYNGVPRLKTAEKPDFEISKPFYFNIGTVLEKKNLHTIVDLARLSSDMDYIIAGSTDSAYAARIQKNKPVNVHFVGKISDENKSWYYENCHGLIFPSLLEGFGLPVVEAMSVGKPLFLSNKTSLPEIGGEDAFYFEDFSPQSMLNTINNGMNSFNVEQANRLKERAANFSWDLAAKKYLSLYNSLI